MAYSDDSDGRSSGFLSGILIGAVIGAGVALLFAPDSGEVTRRKLSKKIKSLRDQAGDGADALGDEVSRQTRRARRGLARAASAVRDEIDELI
jgi:gas vesicle protein